jgi:hypothetical protein
MVQLVEFLFDGAPQRVCTAGRPLQWGGHTWQPVGLQVDPVQDDVGEFGNVSFSLPAVTEAQLALALVEPVQGTVVRVYDALVDPADGTVADAKRAWAGQMDTPGVEDGAQARVVANAEHRGAVALRPKPSRYTHDEQQRLYPGDTALNFDPATDAAALVWPAASYFRQ